MVADLLQVASGVDPERELALLDVEPLVPLDAALLQELQAGPDGVQAEAQTALQGLLVEEVIDDVDVREKLALLGLY